MNPQIKRDRSPALLLLLILVVSCSPTSHFRIRTGDVIKDCQLLHVRDSTLVVQDWKSYKDGMWRTVTRIPLDSVLMLWHVASNANQNIAMGTGAGIGISFGVIFLGPWEGYTKVALLIFGMPFATAAGALIGAGFPAGDLELMRGDPDLLPFLEAHQYYDDPDEMPPILREKALQ